MARVAYADPPYPGQSAKHYADHPDYGGEVDHAKLIADLSEYDGWCLHTSSTALREVLALAPADVRVMAWAKSFCAFKRNVSVAYAWEPVLVKAARKPRVTGRVIMRDYIVAPITMKRGLTGVKPDVVIGWLFEVMGLEPADTLVDLFPGSGAVTRKWREWCAEVSS